MSTSLAYHGFGTRGYKYVRTQYRNGEILFTIRQDPLELRYVFLVFFGCTSSAYAFRHSRQGLEKAFKEEFPKANVQRCQVHGARNVLVNVPKKLKRAVAGDMRSIFYASSKQKPMEIVAGENACYTLLAFICLKMELHWRSNPRGKVRKYLPLLKELAHKNFTEKY